MKRSTIIIAIIATLVLFSGTATWSYLKTFSRQAVDMAKRQVPIDFEIERAKTMIDDMLPEIRETIRTVATEEVEVSRIKDRIADGHQQLELERHSMLEIKQNLQRNEECYILDSRRYTPQQLKQDLTAKFTRYRNRELEIAALGSICESRQISLNAAQQKLNQLVDAKNRLTIEVEQLRARWAANQIEQAGSTWQPVDSASTDAELALESIQKRIEIAEQMLRTETAIDGRIETTTEQEDILATIDKHFAQQDQTAIATNAD